MLFRKKALALFVAGATVTSAFSFPVLAEDKAVSFEDVVEEAIKENQEAFGEATENLTSQFQPVQSQKISLMLGDGLKGLAQMFLGIDLSELSSLDFFVNAKTEDKGEQAELSLQVNEKSIVSFLFNLDFETLDMMFTFPELTDKVIAGNLTEFGDEESIAPVLNAIQMVGNNMAAGANIDAEGLAKSFQNYADILTSHLEQISEETLDLEYVDVKQEVTEYCFDLPNDEYVPLVKELVEAFKADEIMSGLLDQMEVESSESEDEEAFSKSSFYEQLDEAVADLEEAYKDADGTQGLLFYLDLDEESMLRGFAVDSYVYEEEEEEYSYSPLFLFELPTQKNETALYCSVGGSYETGENAFVLCGSGAEEDGQFGGYYYVYYMDEEVAEIMVADAYNDKNGLSASFVIYPADPQEAEEPGQFADLLSSLQGFSIYYDITVAEKENYAELGLNYGEDNYLAISSTSYDPSEVEFTDIGKDQEQVDMSDEEAMADLFGSMDYPKIFENLEAAGISQEMISGLMELFFGEAAA